MAFAWLAVCVASDAVIVVDATGTDRTLRVTLTFDDVDGVPTLHHRDGGALEMSSPVTTYDAAQRHAEVHYTVTLGADGRHGHQGWMSADWATFDGRIFPTPDPAPDAIVVRYTVPPGWRVAAPFPAGPDGHVVPDWGTLATSCIGLGRYEPHAVTLGGAALTVWAALPLGSTRIAELHIGTEALARWFDDTLAFAPDHARIVVLTPRAPDGEGVFGGTSGTGACFDHGAAQRDWELLAHRLAHGVDRYPPSAFGVSAPRDRWFVEGLASWLEVKATEATGLAPVGHRLEHLFGRHRDALASHPAWAVPLATEPRARGDLEEHLHYVTGPLVVAMLDRTVQERTGRPLLAFVRHLVQRHSGGQADLRAELEAWSGTSFDDFWASQVDAPARVTRSWR